MLAPFKKSKLTERWKEGKISNYFYLMMLNQYGSRSYNDLSQYPVLPWFLDYNMFNCSMLHEDELEIRDFEKNLTMLGNQKRLDECMFRFEEGSDFDQDRYHIGSHYSNPGVILQYLVRVPPFLDGLIKFQSNKLDCADRMFSNIAQSYLLALTETGDVRELIPESTVLPEMYKNNLKVNFGKTQEDVEVDQVRLPGWTRQDPYFFT